MRADRRRPQRRDDGAAHQIRLVTTDGTSGLAVGCTCETHIAALVHQGRAGWSDCWTPWIEWHQRFGIVVEAGVTYYDAP